MLYQVTDLSYPAPYNQFTVPPGGLGAIALTVPQGGSLQLQMNQLIPNPQHMPQDQTIRCWIASQRGGNPLPIDSVQWSLTALQRRIISVYDAFANIGPFEGILVDLPPGAYWLNVLNLVNESNSFFLEIKTGA